jgi:glutamine synthetase
VLYKNGAKEIAAQDEMSISYIAKYDEREGSSCHIHFSLSDLSDPARPMVFAADRGVFESFLAGQLACTRELALLLAPNINSYKRYALGSFAPTAARWGVDNRTCAFRLVGHGSSLRIENRVPGGDVNPYLAVAAMIAAGLHGVDHQLPLEPAFEGNAYTDTGPRVPSTLRDALDTWQKSELARESFGNEVVEHYANGARVELAAFDAAVTDWELRRGFERL